MKSLRKIASSVTRSKSKEPSKNKLENYSSNSANSSAEFNISKPKLLPDPLKRFTQTNEPSSKSSLHTETLNYSQSELDYLNSSSAEFDSKPNSRQFKEAHQNEIPNKCVDESVENEFKRGMKELREMRIKYEGMLKVAELTRQSAIDFSNASKKMSFYMFDAFTSSSEKKISKMFKKISSLQFDLAELIEKYGNEISKHISSPTENFLLELDQIEETRKSYNEKTMLFNQFLKENAYYNQEHELEYDNNYYNIPIQLKQEFDEISMTLGSQLLAFKKQNSNHLLSQAVCLNSCQMKLFKKGMKRLRSVEAAFDRFAQEGRLNIDMTPYNSDKGEEETEEESKEEDSMEEEEEEGEGEEEEQDGMGENVKTKNKYVNSVYKPQVYSDNEIFYEKSTDNLNSNLNSNSNSNFNENENENEMMSSSMDDNNISDFHGQDMSDIAQNMFNQVKQSPMEVHISSNTSKVNSVSKVNLPMEINHLSDTSPYPFMSSNHPNQYHPLPEYQTNYPSNYPPPINVYSKQRKGSFSAPLGSDGRPIDTSYQLTQNLPARSSNKVDKTYFSYTSFPSGTILSSSSKASRKPVTIDHHPSYLVTSPPPEPKPKPNSDSPSSEYSSFPSYSSPQPSNSNLSSNVQNFSIDPLVRGMGGPSILSQPSSSPSSMNEPFIHRSNSPSMTSQTKSNLNSSYPSSPTSQPFSSNMPPVPEPNTFGSNQTSQMPQTNMQNYQNYSKSTSSSPTSRFSNTMKTSSSFSSTKTKSISSKSGQLPKPTQQGQSQSQKYFSGPIPSSANNSNNVVHHMNLPPFNSTSSSSSSPSFKNHSSYVLNSNAAEEESLFSLPQSNSLHHEQILNQKMNANANASSSSNMHHGMPKYLNSNANMQQTESMASANHNHHHHQQQKEQQQQQHHHHRHQQQQMSNQQMNNQQMNNQNIPAFNNPFPRSSSLQNQSTSVFSPPKVSELYKLPPPPLSSSSPSPSSPSFSSKELHSVITQSAPTLSERPKHSNHKHISSSSSSSKKFLLPNAESTSYVLHSSPLLRSPSASSSIPISKLSASESKRSISRESLLNRHSDLSPLPLPPDHSSPSMQNMAKSSSIKSVSKVSYSSNSLLPSRSLSGTSSSLSLPMFTLPSPPLPSAMDARFSSAGKMDAMHSKVSNSVGSRDGNQVLRNAQTNYNQNGLHRTSSLNSENLFVKHVKPHEQAPFPNQASFSQTSFPNQNKFPIKPFVSHSGPIMRTMRRNLVASP